jgi:CRP-like cAMP-binding protein
MISPELLRRYPFFASLSEDQLKAIAMITEAAPLKKGEDIFKEKQPADYLYILLDGRVELYFVAEEEFYPERRKEFYMDSINPGEVFGFSALVEPYVYTSTARAAQDGHFIRTDSARLRAMFDQDKNLAYQLMHHTARVILERLRTTRTQLVAAHA